MDESSDDQSQLSPDESDALELDTGASRTIISEAMYRKLWNKNPPTLKKTHVNIQTYTGEKLEILGKIEVHT